jgi:hypothetical protein
VRKKLFSKATSMNQHMFDAFIPVHLIILEWLIYWGVSEKRKRFYIILSGSLKRKGCFFPFSQPDIFLARSFNQQPAFVFF